ncbi:hypothetical protein ACFXOI_05700 [Streptomyces bacillaris]|uniref:hypothetical protein n=1 Tax=Streptomyces bacillaris TaxID=68179 RepID=UPI0036D14939
MDTTCEVCHGHAPADHYLCEACQHTHLAWLKELPHQVVLLRTLLHPDTGPARRGSTGRAHAPIPVRLDVLDLLGPGQAHTVVDPHGDQTGGVPIGAFLSGWAHYIASDVPTAYRDAHGTAHIVQSRSATAWPRTGTGLAAWCTWHERYLPYTATRPYAATLHAELEGLIHRLRRLNHYRPEVRSLDAPCPGCSGWSLVERDDELHITCTICPARLTPAEYAAHRTTTMRQLATTVLLTLDTHGPTAA